MHRCGDILLSVRRLVKLYDRYMEETRSRHGLSQLEITIISFLHNNPGRDTARDICETRMLPKGNVSQGVESLIQKELITRSVDGADRRRIHLALTDRAAPIVEDVERAKETFYRRNFSCFTTEELDFYERMSARIMENILRDLEGKSET